MGTTEVSPFLATASDLPILNSVCWKNGAKNLELKGKNRCIVANLQRRKNSRKQSTSQVWGLERFRELFFSAIRR